MASPLPASVNSSDIASRQATSAVSAMCSEQLMSSEFMPISLLATMFTDLDTFVQGAAHRWNARTHIADCERLAVVFGRSMMVPSANFHEWPAALNGSEA